MKKKHGTDRRTDDRTDTTSYRDATAHLKRILFPFEKRLYLKKQKKKKKKQKKTKKKQANEKKERKKEGKREVKATSGNRPVFEHRK